MRWERGTIVTEPADVWSTEAPDSSLRPWNASGVRAENQRIGSTLSETCDVKGFSIDSETLAFMEDKFDEEFSQVRIFAGDELVERFRARAATIGEEIHFRNGFYDPTSNFGRMLLAHELSHVVQQRDASGNDIVGEEFVFAANRSERLACEMEAQKVSLLVMADERVIVKEKTNKQGVQFFDTLFRLNRDMSALAVSGVSKKLEARGLPPLPKNQKFSVEPFEVQPHGHQTITDKAFLRISQGDTVMTPKGSKALPAETATGWPANLREQLDLGNRRVDIPESLDIENTPVDKWGKPTTEIGVTDILSDKPRLKPIEANKALQDYLDAQDSDLNQMKHFMFTPGDSPNTSYYKALKFIKDTIREATGYSVSDQAQAAFEFGQALHCIQDSFSEAHTKRVVVEGSGGENSFKKWKVTKLNNYKGGEHDPRFDSVSGAGENGARDAEEASADYLAMISGILFLGWEARWELDKGEKRDREPPFLNKWFNPPIEKVIFVKQ